MQKALFKNSFIYSITTFVQKGLVFLLLPLYARFLPPAEYGIITVILACSFICSSFFTFGLDSAILRFYYESSDNPQKFKNLFGTILIALISLSLVAYVLIITVFSPVVQYFIEDIPVYPYAAIGFAIVIFQPLYNLCLAFFQAKNLAGRYSFLSFTYFLINITATVILVMVLEKGAAGYLLAILIAQIASSFIGVFMVRKEFTFTFELTHLKAAMSYSLPLIPHSVAAQATGYADRIILNKLISTSVTGIYHLGYVLSMPIEVLTFSINRAFVPVFFKNADSGGSDNSSVLNAGLTITLIYFVFGTGLALFCYEIVFLLFDDSFITAYQVIPFIAFSFIHTGLYYLFSAILFYDKSLTKYIPVMTVTAGLITIGLDLFLIPLMGILGAGVSLYIGQLTLAILAFVFSRKNKLVDWPLVKIIPGYIIAISISALGYLITDQHWIFVLAIGAKFLLLITLILLISFIYFGNAFEIFERLKLFLNDILKKK